MFYKILFIEIITCVGLIGLRIHQGLPPTSIALGETTVVLKSPPPAAGAITPTFKTSSNPVSALPPKQLTPVKFSARPPLTFPVINHTTDHVISVFGDKRGQTRRHQGIDIKAPQGTPVVATTAGYIERINEGGKGGKQIYLRDGTGRLYYYAHLESWSVEEFDVVEAGDEIGTVGNTGNAKKTTPHLHFEILTGKDRVAVDPMTFWPTV